MLKTARSRLLWDAFSTNSFPFSKFADNHLKQTAERYLAREKKRSTQCKTLSNLASAQVIAFEKKGVIRSD